MGISKQDTRLSVSLITEPDRGGPARDRIPASCSGGREIESCLFLVQNVNILSTMVGHTRLGR